MYLCMYVYVCVCVCVCMCMYACVYVSVCVIHNDIRELHVYHYVSRARKFTYKYIDIY